MGYRLAFEHENIRADMINAPEFPELAKEYNVLAVPKVVINKTVQFEGALLENTFVEKVLEAQAHQ